MTKTKTDIICWKPGCDNKLDKEEIEKYGNSTKYYQLSCDKCKWTSPPISERALYHIVEAGKIVKSITE